MGAVDKMRVVLADTFVLYSRAHSYHWNVTGPHFTALHQFFGEVYEELFSAIDPIAEHIRAMGEFAPFSLAALVAPTTLLLSQEDLPSAENMIQLLILGNDEVLASLRTAHSDATEEKQHGVVNFLEERIDCHETLGWKLRSHNYTTS